LLVQLRGVPLWVDNMAVLAPECFFDPFAYPRRSLPSNHSREAPADHILNRNPSISGSSDASSAPSSHNDGCFLSPPSRASPTSLSCDANAVEDDSCSRNQRGPLSHGRHVFLCYKEPDSWPCSPDSFDWGLVPRTLRMAVKGADSLTKQKVSPRSFTETAQKPLELEAPTFLAAAYLG
jgi:hypothetical protein